MMQNRSSRSRRSAACRLTAIAFVCLSLLAASLLTACGRRSSAAGMILAGSTSVQPFAEILSEEYAKIHAGTTIDVQGGGSSSGIKAAQTGTSDIGMSSRELKGDEKSLWSVEIAKDGLAVIVHPDNPIRNLTLEQVRGIYTHAVTDWSQLGGPAGKIHVFTREEGSGTRDAFASLVMSKAEITPRALVQDSNGAVRQLIADDPNAIGYISLGLVNSQVRAIELNGIAATHDNVINGSYKLARPFLFVANTAPVGEVKLFVDFVLSSDGKDLLDAEGLITSRGGSAG